MLDLNKIEFLNRSVLNYSQYKKREDELKCKLDEINKSMNSLPSFSSDISSLYEEYKKIVLFLEESNRQKDLLDGVLKTIFNKMTLNDKVSNFFSEAIDEVTLKFIQTFEDMLNKVYQFVYSLPDRKVQLKIVEERNRKVLRLNFLQIIDEKVYEEDFTEEGHSVSVVLGTVILIYFIIYNNLPRIIIFDESFSGLSDQTLDKFFIFLKSFISDLEFKFLIVSHDVRLEKFSDKTYFAARGKYTLMN